MATISARSIAPICGALLLLSGCGTTEKQPQRTVPTVSPTVPQERSAGVPRTPDPSEYIRQSGSLTLLSIRAAEAAIQRSSNGNVRSIAQLILKDHTGLSSQLSFAGRRLNLLPSARLLPQHEAILRNLISSSNFDRAYVSQQRSIAMSGYRLHSDYLRAGTSPTLKPVARNALAVISSELNRLRRL